MPHTGVPAGQEFRSGSSIASSVRCRTEDCDASGENHAGDEPIPGKCQNGIGSDTRVQSGVFVPAGVADMISIEEQRILASLAEVSADIKSHLILIGELAAQRVEADTGACRPPSLGALQAA